MIKVISFGKIKEKYLEELIDDYQKRITKYHKIEIYTLKEDTPLKEVEAINKIIKPNDYIISLAIEGNSISSVDFAHKLEDIFNHYSSITFIIGESNGLPEIIKNNSNYLLSFSKMTFPHYLFQGMLLEQIYRAFKIINNETYHK